MRPSVRILLIALCLLSISQPGWCQASIGNISFGQADWYDVTSTGGSLLMQYSSWGRMDLDVTGDASSTWYLNVVASANATKPWLVQNLPLFSQALDPGTVGVSVDFSVTDFGLVEGSALTGLTYGYSLTASPLETAPSVSTMTSTTTNTLVYRALTLDGGLVDRGPSFGAPAGIKAAGAASVATNAVEHSGVPRVKEDDSQCMPGAFARSLSWLNEKNKLGYGKSAQEIYGELKGEIGIEKKLKDDERIKKKADCAKKISKNIVTKVRDVRGVLGPIDGVPEDGTTDFKEWLKREMKTEDVELTYYIFGNGTDKDPTGAHIVTVTGMYDQGGKTYIKFRDDESQVGTGAGAGDAREKRGELGLVDGKYWFRNDKRLVAYAVSESVIPEPVFFQFGALMGLGSIGMVKLRKR